MIAIIDFGSQFTGLISKELANLGTDCSTHSPAELRRIIREDRLNGITGVILSGSPRDLSAEDFQWASEVFPTLTALNIPTLGICFGLQLMAGQFGCELLKGEHREYGRTEITQTKEGLKNPLFKNVPERSSVWMSHGNSLRPSPELEILSVSNAIMTAFQINNKNLYAVLFHPEVTHSDFGKTILKNFLVICGSLFEDKGYDWGLYLEEQKERLKDVREIVCAVSGGVDSTVVAVLLSKFTHVHAIYVDHGLQRDYDLNDLQTVFKNFPNIKLHILNERERFLSSLRGISDPEEKRKIIGKCFIDSFSPYALDLGIKHFAQGTIASDVVESGKNEAGTAQKIKSHHNVGALPKDLPFTLVEPVRSLFKDQVRALGLYLKIPESFIRRHPFPGPGLAIRCLGEIQDGRIELLRRADAIFNEELRTRNLYHKTWQAGVILLPIKSTGVMGDGNSYEECIAIRMVDSIDAMTAEATEVPWKDLKEITNRLINEVKGINRVVYDVTSKPPATIEWE